MRGFIPPSSDEERLFCRRVEDAVSQVHTRGGLRVLTFCTEREQTLAEAVLQREKHAVYAFYGGYEQAERKMLAVGEYDIPTPLDFPIVSLWIQPFRGENLTHRDYLGALMGLRISRETMGDIVMLGQEGAVLFAQERAAGLICDELREVGRCTVSVSSATAEQLSRLSVQADKPPQTATVASLRLDALLAAMLKVSRGTAGDLIRSKHVMVNHLETTSCHYEVCAGDSFTVRGQGKYKLVEIGQKSRKDRTFITYIQY